MTGIINNIISTYNYIIDDLADVRNKNLPLMESPLTVILTVIVYLKICTDYGPRIMKNRKPFELKYSIMAYNIFQVLLSTFLVYEGLQYYLHAKNYDLFCDPFPVNNDFRTIRIATSCWWYMFAKFTELLDTIFFVLRKKDRQVSTLHLYHHSMVIISSWMAAKYFPGGPIILLGTLNSVVHILMYSYYFIAGLGPQYQKYLWWKKHVTLVQLIQFVIVIAHNTTSLFRSCNYPKTVHFVIICNMSYLLYMFGVFYYKNYIKMKPKKNEEVTTKLKEINIRQRKRLSVGQ